MLRSLHTRDVGPAALFDLELGERLNVLTGDNGLGKSFLLEVAWWALTGTWTDRPILPPLGKEDSALITGEMTPIGERTASTIETFESRFQRPSQRWDDRFRRDTGARYFAEAGNERHFPDWITAMGLVVHAHSDGTFSILDPTRNHARAQQGVPTLLAPEPYHFTKQAIWDGLEQHGRVACNGLLRDWITWQLEAAVVESPQHPFALLSRLLGHLSHPEEPMTPGKPVRLYLDDSRQLPTIDLPHEKAIPIVHASAGMKRILMLAYLLTWAWTEHLRAARILDWPAPHPMVLLLEEPETHLHPKWQRHIVPAILRVLADLPREADEARSSDAARAEPLQIQVLLTTHSPLVLASLEPHVDPERDRLFSINVSEHKEVVLDELP